MLTVETHRNLRDSQQVQANRVVVRDRYNNPIAMVVDDGSLVHIKSATDPDFQDFLEAYGIPRTVIVKDMPASSV